MMVTIPKKGKDLSRCENYRGIVITSILGKVLDHILQARDTNIFNSQHEMQYGFTRGKSPSMASLLLTEAICENLDARQPTYVAALDAQKAFDVVYQNSLLRRIYLQGGHKHWRYYAASIRGTKIRVRIDGELSSTVCISQGVGQGRVPSTGNYKIFIDPVLRLLSDMNAGQFIGPYFCGCPTCADDILLVAESPDELQAQLDVVFAFSAQERYRIHPQKSKIIITGDTNPETTSNRWYLGDEPLEITDNCTHLGLERATSQLTPHSLISDRIQLARRTAYSLTGAGFHGNTGISPSVCRRMISTYIIPRLLFGLEAMILTDRQLQRLEVYLRQLLRQLQNFSDRVANSAVLLLIGIPPVAAQLHIRTLTFLGAIMRSEDSALRQIAIRQLAIKDFKSKSWFIYCARLLYKYDLPSIHHLVSFPPTKTYWARLVKRNILSYWESQLQLEGAQKSSLQNLDISKTSFRHPHAVWTTTSCEVKDVTKARVKAKLLTGSYPLQTNTAKFNKSEVDPTCKLCNSSPEDTYHFLLACPALEDRRKKFYPQFHQLIPDQELTPKLILDSSATVSHLPFSQAFNPAVELVTKRFCHTLHCRRQELLNTLSSNHDVAPVLRGGMYR